MTDLRTVGRELESDLSGLSADGVRVIRGDDARLEVPGVAQHAYNVIAIVSTIGGLKSVVEVVNLAVQRWKRFRVIVSYPDVQGIRQEIVISNLTRRQAETHAATAKARDELAPPSAGARAEVRIVEEV